MARSIPFILWIANEWMDIASFVWWVLCAVDNRCLWSRNMLQSVLIDSATNLFIINSSIQCVLFRAFKTLCLQQQDKQHEMVQFSSQGLWCHLFGALWLVGMTSLCWAFCCHKQHSSLGREVAGCSVNRGHVVDMFLSAWCHVSFLWTPHLSL